MSSFLFCTIVTLQIATLFAGYPFPSWLDDRSLTNPKENGRYESKTYYDTSLNRLETSVTGSAGTTTGTFDCTYAAAYARIEIDSVLSTCLYDDYSAYSVVKDDIMRYCNDAVGSCTMTLTPGEYGTYDASEQDCRYLIDFYCLSPAGKIKYDAQNGQAYTDDADSSAHAAGLSAQAVVVNATVSVMLNLIVIGVIYYVCFYKKCCAKKTKKVEVAFDHDRDANEHMKETDEIEVEVEAQKHSIDI